MLFLLVRATNVINYSGINVTITNKRLERELETERERESERMERWVGEAVIAGAENGI